METDKFKELADYSDATLVKAIKALDPNYNINLMTEDRFCPYDAVVELNGVNYLTEVKHRNAKYDTMMLEHKKAESIFAVADKSINLDKGFLYVNTFSDNTALIWYITRENLKYVSHTKLFAPATTAGDDRSLNKASYLLPSNFATQVNI